MPLESNIPLGVGVVVSMVLYFSLEPTLSELSPPLAGIAIGMIALCSTAAMVLAADRIDGVRFLKNSGGDADA